MTTIAWDGKTLAADKMASSGNAKWGQCTKIFRTRAGLVGFAGSADIAMALLHWVENGCEPSEFPTINAEENDTLAMVISPTGTVTIYERTPHPQILHNEFVAIGSGRDFAMAAMHLGNSAEKAVEVAAALDAYTGNGVDALTL